MEPRKRVLLMACAAAIPFSTGCRDRPVTEPPRCGDGRVAPGELCDDGEGNSDVEPGACRTDCTPARCGDGVLDPGEACDGTELDGASCSSLEYYGGDLGCQADCTYDLGSCAAAGRCGDGVLQAVEECDDGNDLKWDGCEGCQVMDVWLGPFGDALGVFQAAITLENTGWSQVAFTRISGDPSSTPYTITFQVLPAWGGVSPPEYVFLPWPMSDCPSKTGFTKPDVVLIRQSEQSIGGLIVFQECDEAFSCDEPLDGSGTGVFRSGTPADDPPLLDQVNTFTAGNQARPRLAALWNGESVVAWQSEGQDGSGWGVFAQPYTRDGTPLGPEIAVNETTAGDQRAPDVAMLENGGFVLVWESWTDGGVNQGVFLRRFDPLGTPLGAEVSVAEAAPVEAGHQAPRVAAGAGAGAGGFVVVWQAFSEDGDGWGVFGRPFLADGTPVSGDLALAEEWQGDQVRPAVAVDGAGSFVAVWQDQSSGEWFIRGRRFGSQGQALGGELEISRKQAAAYAEPDIAMTSDGRFAVAWDTGGISVQRFLPDGTPIGLAPW